MLLLRKKLRGTKVLLPVWHNIDRTEVSRFSALLADRLAVSSSKGITSVANEIIKAISRISGPKTQFKDPTELFSDVAPEDISRIEFKPSTIAEFQYLFRDMFDEEKTGAFLNLYATEMNRLIDADNQFGIPDLFAAHDICIRKAFAHTEPGVEEKDILAEFLTKEALKTRGWEDAGLSDEQRTKLSRLSEAVALQVEWICPTFVKQLLWSLDEADELVLTRYMVEQNLAPETTKDSTLYIWNNYFLGGRSAVWIYRNLGEALTNKFDYVSPEEYEAIKQRLENASKSVEISLSTGYTVEVTEISATVDHLLNAVVMEHFEDHIKGNRGTLKEEVQFVAKNINADLRLKLLPALREKGRRLAGRNRNAPSHQDSCEEAFAGLLLQVAELHRARLISEAFPRLNLDPFLL